MHTRSRFLRAFLLLVAFTVPATSRGQGAPRTIDEGSFSITIGGQRAGRENFSIKATPRGQSVEYLAQAQVVYGDRRLIPALVADSLGAPMTYEITTRNAGDTEKWAGTIVRGRVSARILTPRGQMAREYIVTEGAVILDDDVYHQYYFVARSRSAGSVPVVIPRRNAQARLQISTAGQERLTIGTRELDATHLVLSEPGGDQRDLWIDSEGRVLKVEVPARGIVVTRDDPPQ
jgi:hypothetical protein